MSWSSGPSRTPRCPGTPTPSRRSPRSSSSWSSPTWPRSRPSSTSAAGPPSRTRAWRARSPPWRAPTRRSPRASPCTGRASTPTTGPLLKSLFLLTDKPVLAVVNVGEDQLERSDELAGAVAAALEGHGEALGVCVQLEAEAARLAPEERAELLEGLGLGAGCADAGGAACLPAARAARLPHDRATRNRGPGASGPAPTRRSARA